MKIVTFNINGIKARLHSLSDWIKQSQPDVVLLQEIKSIDDNFPQEHFENMGYQVVTHGQKSFNGVAILSKFPLEDVIRGLPGDTDDIQARWIEATVIGKKALRLCGLYLPNGNPVPGPKFDYKLDWMKRFRMRAQELIQTEEIALMGGDYNIIPQAEDAAIPTDWKGDALHLPESRAAYRDVINLGFTDAFRCKNNGPGHYSFWDYQAGSWQRNNGIRIDHFLLTPKCADLLIDVGIDSYVRGADKPSDHVPVWLELDS